MANNAFRVALSPAALHEAWNGLYQNSSSSSRNTVGVDNVSINDFEHSSKSHLRQIYKELRTGAFQFQSLNPFRVPKTNGKFRIIAVPSVRDRVVQRALVEYLSVKYRFKLANKVSYGFIKKRSVKQAANNACAMRKAQPWVFKTDITSFFDTINRDILRSSLEKIIREKSLYKILGSALECEIDDCQPRIIKQLHESGIKRGLGVRQGMPLSPLFSNIMLLPFDEAIEAKGYHAVRYADDLIFLAKSRAECIEIADFCRLELAKLNLTIPLIEPGSKSVIYNPTEPADFLGLELAPVGKSYEVRLAHTQIDRIRDELLGLGSISELLSRKITLKNLGQVLAAKRDGFLAAYDICANKKQLANQLVDLEQKALRRVYEKGLGIDMESLTSEARTFLGLT